MARGILSGMIVGTMVASVGAAGLSLLAGPPAPRMSAKPPVADVAQDPASQPAPEAASEGPVTVTNTQDAPAVGQAPTVETPAADRSVSAETTAPVPDTADVDVAAEAPAETGEQTTIATTDDAPSSTSQTAPELPAQDSDVAVATEPATADVEETPVPLPAPLPDAEREEITLEVAPELPDAEAEPAPAPTTGVIGKPAKTLGSSQSTRLPSVQTNVEQVPENEAQSSSSVDENAPPFKRFAQPFEGDATKPKMSIVLIDDGTSNIGFEALTTFPYPLSFAVDTSWKGARDAMDAYRTAGFEVLAMVDLPRGARASDVEVALPVLLEAVPEAVGVMETPDAGLQDSREVSGQVSEYLANSGHGLLLFPKGLNTAQKLAAKEGVPSATVFRDFDIKGQNASAIKRFLDHAALKAGTEGGVVMVGRLRADTISALLLWGLQDRSDRLELAPVSQLLKEPN